MITPAEQSVLDLVNGDDLIKLTTSLLRAHGENPPGDEGDTVAALAAGCVQLGLDFEAVRVEEPGRDNLSAVLTGGDGPGLLLLGHSDVVGVGEGWTVDPFGAEIRDGRIYGRGAADMKGGLAACVIAMAALRASGVKLSGPVELAVVVDEEETGKGIQHFINANSGTAYRACVVAEPTDLQTIIGARGDSYLRVKVTGRAAHAGNAAAGVNAIYGATAVIAEIERVHAELARDPHPLLGPAAWSVGQIHGGTGASIVPAECVLMADRRLLPGESPAEVLADLRRRVDALGLTERGLTVELEMPMEMPAFETAADDPLVVVADQAVTDAGGPGLPPGGWAAACDGGFIARDLGVPTVVLGPGSLNDQAHRADESVALDELLTAARAYTLLALRLLS
ncbi:M20 family metallopeptidase [Kribbella deserti]|uniref:Probable succinyl-diaminopimelate desuccinylase n=1 Tax=Kribbella deserti TaxID=1926257 RepID=A0ABV6QKC6_9ACTN